MASKVTTFNINSDLWKEFNKKLVDKEITSKGRIMSELIKKFLNKKININIFEESQKEKLTVGLHINEEVWLDLDIYLSEQKKIYLGHRAKQKALNKGNILVKLIKYYIELKNGGI